MEPNERMVKAKQQVAQHRLVFSCRQVDEAQDARVLLGIRCPAAHVYMRERVPVTARCPATVCLQTVRGGAF